MIPPERIREALQEVSEESMMMDKFFRLIAVCHTVVPEAGEDSNHLIYQVTHSLNLLNFPIKAASPDELALVEGARDYGYVFEERTIKSIQIKSSCMNYYNNEL